MLRRTTAREAERVGSTNGLGQMTGNCRGLRRDVQSARPQYLVASARNRITCRSAKAKQHVPNWLLARHLGGALDLERGIAVVQKRHVGRTQRFGYGGHAFVARRADGVEAFTLLLHRAAGAVEVAAEGLTTKHLDKFRRLDRNVCWRAIRQIIGAHASQEILVYDCCAIH